MKSIVYNTDCLEAMRQMPDKTFDLAIVDPPYGIEYARGKNGFGDNANRPERAETKWDAQPPKWEYFDELRRVSVNQIIWGGNFFTDKLPVSKCWLIWDKVGETQAKNPFADCDMAWTSFTKVVKKFTLRQIGFINDTRDGTRIHPTQKPTELYIWLLTNYAKPGDTILDTHLGSGSSRIAAYDLGFDFTGYELDTDYFEAQEERFQNHIAQARLFATPVLETVEQSDLFGG